MNEPSPEHESLFDDLESNISDPNVRITTQRLTDSVDFASADIAMEPPDSGDFQESFVVPDGSGDIAVLMGDVTGHGRPAAVKADLIRAEAVAHLKAGDSPKQTAEAANAVSQTPDERYATFFVAKIDGDTGDVLYANAGHEPPVITRSDGSVVLLETSGPPLGVVPAGVPVYDQKFAHLPQDGSMVLITDGVTEARKPFSAVLTLFGYDEFMAIVQRLCRDSPLQIVQSVVNRVLRFTRSMLSDDVIVMALKRHSSPSSNSKSAN